MEKIRSRQLWNQITECSFCLFSVLWTSYDVWFKDFFTCSPWRKNDDTRWTRCQAAKVSRQSGNQCLPGGAGRSFGQRHSTTTIYDRQTLMTVLPCVINVVKIWHGKTAVSWYPSTGLLCTIPGIDYSCIATTRRKGEFAQSSNSLRSRLSQFFRPIGFWKCTHTQIQKQDQIWVSCTLVVSCHLVVTKIKTWLVGWRSKCQRQAKRSKAPFDKKLSQQYRLLIIN